MLVYKKDETHEGLIWVAIPCNAIKRVSGSGKTLEIFNSGFSELVPAINQWGQSDGEALHFNGEIVSANVRLSIRNADYSPSEEDDRSARKTAAVKRQEKLDQENNALMMRRQASKIVKLDRPVLNSGGNVEFPTGSAVDSALLTMNLEAGIWSMGPAATAPRE